MSHFAELDKNSTVIRVLVIDPDEVLKWPGTWQKTYYDAAQRENPSLWGFNFAGTGFVYDSIRKAFIPPQPYFSWSLNENTCQWESPIPMPTDGKMYAWNEKAKNWIKQ
jgi:hypothetical protein